MYLVSPILITASVAAKPYCEAKNNTTLCARCAYVCTDAVQKK